MKHFIIKITYTSNIEEIEKVLVEHRSFLQQGYDQEFLLCSGPLNPRTGGVVIAKSESLETIKSFFEKDPYNIHKLVNYEFLEFNPVKSQSFLSDWISD
ncbi:MAG: YciI family protein [Cyanobacteriota bacterium]|mgnify:CR=1 FL=1